MLRIALIAMLLTGCMDTDGDGISDTEEELLGLNPDDSDTDRDGLPDNVEVALGTDPFDSDTDRDGILDGEEAAYRTHPLNPDTDGDTYLDGHELHAGTDPADRKSRIYKGRWPYNPDKDEIGQGKVETPANLGKRMPRMHLIDQHGEEVDLYDFLGQRKDVLINLSAWNCSPNTSFGDFLAGVPSPWDDMEGYVALRSAILEGDVYWLNIVYTRYIEPTESTAEDAAEWHELFPAPGVPALADPDLEMWDFAFMGGTPSIVLLDQNGIVLAGDLAVTTHEGSPLGMALKRL